MEHETRSRGPRRFFDIEAVPALKNPASIVLVALATLLVFAWLDHLGEGRYSMTMLYLIPVAVVGWYVGRDWGRLAALAAGAAQTASQLLGNPGASQATVAWNGLMIVALSLVVNEVLARLNAALMRESDLARTDELTGLPNTRSFDELAGMEIERARRYARTFTAACLDLDHFKEVNDSLGHAAGDRLLSDVGAALRDNLRRVDIVARIGGDEFAVLLPETDEVQAGVALSHVRIALKDLTGAYGTEVRASIGAVTFPTPPESVAVMLRAADSAMYRAKSAGRDRVESLTVTGDAESVSAGRPRAPR